MRRSKTHVANLHRRAFSPYCVNITRGTKWGNPFEVGKDGSREQVIEKYEEWVKTQPQLLFDLHELVGKTLMCVCHPLPCHGDVLARLANELQPEGGTP